jgi:enoyl-[acyl-carrier protein] reductase III
MSTSKIALVTGSSRGIGRAINLELARRGYRCVVHYRRDVEAAEAAAAELRELDQDPILVRADLNEEAGVRVLFDAVRDLSGELGVFVANAASTRLRPLLESEPEQVERVFRQAATNFVLSVQLAAPLLVDGGRIVAVSGLQSRAVIPGYGLLGPAKAAMEEMVKHLAVELGPRRITVNAVIPGFIETQSAQLTMGDGYEASAARLEACIPIGRRGTPADVAGLVSFLASSAAEFITGQGIIVDGGMSVLGTSSVVARSVSATTI